MIALLRTEATKALRRPRTLVIYGFLVGLPFLLVWNLVWMAATAAILAILFHLDERDTARDGRTGDAQ